MDLKDDDILQNKMPLIEISDTQGNVKRIYFDKEPEGFESNVSVVNLATPYIKGLHRLISKPESPVI